MQPIEAAEILWGFLRVVFPLCVPMISQKHKQPFMFNYSVFVYSFIIIIIISLLLLLLLTYWQMAEIFKRMGRGSLPTAAATNTMLSMSDLTATFQITSPV